MSQDTIASARYRAILPDCVIAIIVLISPAGSRSTYSSHDAHSVMPVKEAPKNRENHCVIDAAEQTAMTPFDTLRLPTDPTVVAPDGSDVRVLLRLAAGSMAHFELGAGKVSLAVVHRSVEEIWFIVAGRGEMWRKQADREEVVALQPGVCLTIPAGTHFQFRACEAESVAAVAVTMPPWPGESEASSVQGHWAPTDR